MTLAHALKRVLVSSLSGVAIIALQIEGITSKEQRISGMEERVMDILLNIKQVRLRCFSASAISMSLYTTGKREVTAADIIVPNTIEIMNLECHIANLLGEDAHLALEMVAQVGKGYVSAIEETDARGFLLDAIYTIRSYNALKRYGFMTKVGHILVQDEKELRDIHNIG